MSDELHQERASLYVLGLLSSAEERALEQQFKQDESLRQLVSELRTAAAAVPLGLNAQQPPAALKQRIFASIDAASNTKKQSQHALLSGVQGRRSSALFGWAGWLAAACLLLALLWDYQGAARITDELQQARSERDMALKTAQTSGAAVTELNAKLAQVLKADPLGNQRMVRLGPPPQTASPVAMVLWDQQHQSGSLLLDGLPAAAAGSDYQLWIIDPSYKAPVDCGVFSIGRSGVITVKFNPKSKVTQASKFAITLEKKGGVPVPQGSMVLLGG